MFVTDGELGIEYALRLEIEVSERLPSNAPFFNCWGGTDELSHKELAASPVSAARPQALPASRCRILGQFPVTAVTGKVLLQSRDAYRNAVLHPSKS